MIRRVTATHAALAAGLLAVVGLGACGGEQAPATGAPSPAPVEAATAEAPKSEAAATADGAGEADGWRLTLASSKAGRTLADVDTERIVSVGGPVTEVVWALGAGDRVVAVDRTSIHPNEVRSLPNVGMFGELSAEGILALSPTVVVATSEAGPQPVLDQLVAAGVDIVTVPDVVAPDEAVARVRALGELLGTATKAAEVASALEAGVDAAVAKAKGFAEPPRTLFVYARGTRTLLVSGAGTPAARMIALAGGKNAIDSFEGFRPLTAEGVVSAAPEWILIPKRGLESVGEIDGLLGLPGIANTPAGRARRVIAIDDLALLGFGPRTPGALGELQRGWSAGE